MLRGKTPRVAAVIGDGQESRAMRDVNVSLIVVYYALNSTII